MHIYVYNYIYNSHYIIHIYIYMTPLPKQTSEDPGNNCVGFKKV